MNIKTLSIFVLFAAAALVVVGCGGQTNGIGDGRGEGNIPIGKIANVRPLGAVVYATTSSGGTLTSSTDDSGVFSMPRLAYGATSFTVVPNDPQLATESFTVQVGSWQKDIVRSTVHKKDLDAVVDSITIDIPNRKELRVGVAVPIKVTIVGSNVKDLKPTVWVDGGLGQIEDPDRFTPEALGAGQIRAELLGKSASLDITVR